MIIEIVVAVVILGLIGAVAIGVKHHKEHKAEERHYQGARLRSYVSAAQLEANRRADAADEVDPDS